MCPDVSGCPAITCVSSTKVPEGQSGPVAVNALSPEAKSTWSLIVNGARARHPWGLSWLLRARAPCRRRSVRARARWRRWCGASWCESSWWLVRWMRDRARARAVGCAPRPLRPRGASQCTAPSLIVTSFEVRSALWHVLDPQPGVDDARRCCLRGERPVVFSESVVNGKAVARNMPESCGSPLAASGRFLSLPLVRCGVLHRCGCRSHASRA